MDVALSDIRNGDSDGVRLEVVWPANLSETLHETFFPVKIIKICHNQFLF